jgi:transcriptional regulator with XRE-family HTH domain
MFRKMDEQERCFYVRFGVWVRSERNRLGWSREKLGEKIGLSGGSITQVELGRQRLALHQYALLIVAFGADAGPGFDLDTVRGYVPRRSLAGRRWD